MKRLLLLLLLTPLSGISQTKTTVQDGDFFNPLVWDCTCLPENGDQLIINHNLVLNIDVAYDNGSITINSSGSLIDDGNDRAFWVDGTGILDNAGTFTSHLFLASPDADITNTGDMPSLDSVMNQGSFINSGSFEAFDFLNDQTGYFENSNMVTINNDFNNQGEFYIDAGASVEVANDFSNCNLQSEYAWFENDGIMCISNDFSNCPDDTLAGSGDYFVSGNSSNLGVFSGDFTFHTPSGTVGVPGTIEPSVTVTTGTCTLIVDESEGQIIQVHPNPTQGIVSVALNEVPYKVYSLTGQQLVSGIVQQNMVDLSGLDRGWYLLDFGSHGNVRVLKM